MCTMSLLKGSLFPDIFHVAVVSEYIFSRVCFNTRTDQSRLLEQPLTPCLTSPVTIVHVLAPSVV